MTSKYHYRRDALRAYENRCVDCGLEGTDEITIEVHHKDGTMDPTLSNLEMLCGPCHDKRHLAMPPTQRRIEEPKLWTRVEPAIADEAQRLANEHYDGNISMLMRAALTRFVSWLKALPADLPTDTEERPAA